MPNAFTLKIEEGADVMQKIAELMEKQGIREIFLVKATGRLRDPEIVSHGREGRVSTETLRGDYGINAISGSIERKKGLTSHQINVAVTQTGVNAKIGKLIKAKAGQGLEFGLRKIDLSKMIM